MLAEIWPPPATCKVDVEITTLTSRQEGNPHVAMIHPALASRLDLCLEDLHPAAIVGRADVIFSCLPHGVTASLTPQFLELNPFGQVPTVVFDKPGVVAIGTCATWSR